VTIGADERNTRIYAIYVISVLAFFLLSYLIPLGARPLAAPDETRYAEIPREMIDGRDWTVPRLNGVRYFEKPPLGYWAGACSILVLGENNFAVRFPSALFTGLSALALYLAVLKSCRRTCDESGGVKAVSAAFVFLSCFEVFSVGNIAVLDAIFSFFVTAAVLAFFIASEEGHGSSREKFFMAMAGAFCGLAFLTKGFVAFVVPILSLCAFLAWEGRRGDILRMGWIPLLAAALVALPWSVLIHLREPDFWKFFFWNEHIRRFVAENAQHKEPFYFFFAAAFATFFPWTLALPAALAGIREEVRARSMRGRLVRLSICWFILPFLFFSLCNGKLLTYILPCFPPFAIIVSLGLANTLEKNGKSTLFDTGAACSAVISAILSAVFLYVQILGYNGHRIYEHMFDTAAVSAGLLFLTVFFVLSMASRNAWNKIALYAAAPLLFFFAIHYTIPDTVIQTTSPGVVLQHYMGKSDKSDIIIADGDSAAAACWYLRRDDVFVLGPPGELDYGLGRDGSCSRSVDEKAAADIIRKNRGKVLLMATDDNIRRWYGSLPRPLPAAGESNAGYAVFRY